MVRKKNPNNLELSNIAWNWRSLNNSIEVTYFSMNNFNNRRNDHTTRKSIGLLKNAYIVLK